VMIICRSLENDLQSKLDLPWNGPRIRAYDLPRRGITSSAGTRKQAQVGHPEIFVIQEVEELRSELNRELFRDFRDLRILQERCVHVEHTRSPQDVSPGVA